MRITVLGGGAWGTALASHSRARGLACGCGSASPRWPSAINERRENPAFLPGRRAARRAARDQRAGRGASPTPRRCWSSSRPSSAARSTARLAGWRPRRRELRLGDQGSRDRDAAAHERGGGGRGTPGRPLAVALGPVLRARGGARAADGRGRGLARTTASPSACSGRSRHAQLPRLRERRRGRRRAGRRAQERDRDRRRHRRRAGLRPQHRGGADHARPRRDHAARRGARRRGRTRSPGLAGPGRPGADLHRRRCRATARWASASAGGRASPRRAPGMHGRRGRAHDARRLRAGRARGVEMPIARQMQAVLYEGKPPRAAVDELMLRSLKRE